MEKKRKLDTPPLTNLAYNDSHFLRLLRANVAFAKVNSCQSPGLVIVTCLSNTLSRRLSLCPARIHLLQREVTGSLS